VRRLLRSLRRIAIVALALVLVWLAGLGWFVVSSLAMRADPSASTDAIVVLTGGKLRLETGIELLAAGKARKLFVSGVNQQVDREELLRTLGPQPDRVTCCVVLGHAADNTQGNARESAAWMHEEGYRSLRLVTSWYHMRRSLLEFGRAMPGVAIVAHPVFAQRVDLERWWGWHGAALLIIEEYHKFLATWVRPLIEAVLSSPSKGPIMRTTAADSPAGRRGR
jgi:uncharacterized SAM-binding protein YcdF (DUF218 family)